MTIVCEASVQHVTLQRCSTDPILQPFLAPSCMPIWLHPAAREKSRIATS